MKELIYLMIVNHPLTARLHFHKIQKVWSDRIFSTCYHILLIFDVLLNFINQSAISCDLLITLTISLIVVCLLIIDEY